MAKILLEPVEVLFLLLVFFQFCAFLSNGLKALTSTSEDLKDVFEGWIEFLTFRDRFFNSSQSDWSSSFVDEFGENNLSNHLIQNKT